MMRKTFLRASVCGALLLGLAALPAVAQSIPPGNDFWVTPANGQTVFEFPAGDVESLCGLPAQSGWDHKVALKGVPVAGSDYDTVVARLDKAVFDSSGNAFTRIVVKHLAFRSIAAQKTPCGELSWTVGLTGGQAVTNMKLRRTTRLGGVFAADIAVNLEFRATDANGNYVGSLFYNIILPDPNNGTPWSFGPSGEFRAGMTETDDCIDVLRKKLLTYSPDSSHFYYISDMIAQGRCKPQG